VPAVTSVAIIGTGFGGLAAAVRLKQAGLEDPQGEGPATDGRVNLTNTMSP